MASQEPMVHTAGPILLWRIAAKNGVCAHREQQKLMIFITTQLLENVLPKLPIRQWVLSVPKWQRV